MSVTFDGQNKIIQVNSGVTSIDVRDVYSRWKEWLILSDNAKWSAAFRVVGGDPIGGGAISPIFFFLINGWTIRPDDTSGNHTLSVSLNLYADPETNPRFTDVAGVAINNQTSESPGVNAQTIRDAMTLAHTVGLTIADGSIDHKLDVLAKYENNRWEITNNQLVIYDDDGVTPYKTFNLFDQNGNPTMTSPFERVPV